MSTITHRVDERDASGVTSRAPLSATSALAGVLALVGAWAAATLMVAFRRRAESAPVWLGIVTLAGAGALATDRLTGAVPYALAALSATLPTGAITGRRFRATRRFLGATVVVGAPFVAAVALNE